LRNNEFGNEENITIGGDFNCPLDPSLDKKGGLSIPRKYVINVIDEIQSEFSLHDIWHLKIQLHKVLREHVVHRLFSVD